MKQVPELVGAMISDGLQLLDFLGGSTSGAAASVALKAFLQRKTSAGREILFDEVGRGNILPPQAAAQDDMIAVSYHYFRTACSGTARVNLRLMAKAIAGRLATSNLVADEFLAHVDALAALSRDEIVFIATMYRIKRQRSEVDEEDNDDLWHPTVEELGRIGWSLDRVRVAASRAQRSGYVLAASAWGGLLFQLSPLLLDLCATVDFYDALRREGLAS